MWRYLLGQFLAPLVGALSLIAGLIWILQGLRLGHHLIGAGPWALGRIILLSLPFLLTFAFPLALAGSILLVLGRLRAQGELLALQAAGASPLQIAAPALMLSLGGALSVLLLAEVVQPRTTPLLVRLLSRSGVQTVLGQAAPGRFHRLLDNTTLFIEERRPGAGEATAVSGLLLSQERPPLLLVARRAEIRPRGDLSLGLELHQGELHRGPGQGEARKGDTTSSGLEGLQRLRFKQMSLTLNLGGALQRHLGFVQSLGKDRSPWTGPLNCLALGLLITVIGLGRGSPWSVAVKGLTAVAVFQLAIWGVQVILPGALGAGLLAGCVGGLCGVRLATT